MTFRRGFQGQSLSRSHSKPSSSRCARHGFFPDIHWAPEGQEPKSVPAGEVMEASKIPSFHQSIDPFSSSVGDDLLLPLQREALTKGTGTTKAQRWPVPMAGVNTSPLMLGWSRQLPAAALLLVL